MVTPKRRRSRLPYQGSYHPPPKGIIVDMARPAQESELDHQMNRHEQRAAKTAAKRTRVEEQPDMKRHDRKQLVGLLTEDPVSVLPEGSHIVAEKKRKPPMPTIGHVTSSYFSACLDRSIALALLVRGREQLGETVSVYVDGIFVPAKVTEPRFFDLDGHRLRG